VLPQEIPVKRRRAPATPRRRFLTPPGSRLATGPARLIPAATIVG